MSVVVIAINPAEILKRARDTKRINDLSNLHELIQLANSEGLLNSTICNGTNIYISLPSNIDLSNINNLPSGFSWVQVSEDNLRKSDSTGWIPINVSDISGFSMPTLPVDPQNTLNDNLYYTFYCNPQQEYILTSYMESKTFGPKGNETSKTNKDGGPDPYLYEVGSNLFISPLKPVGSWSFDEGAGTIANDSSGNNNNGTLYNGPTWTEGQVNKALSFDGSDDQVIIDISTTSTLDLTNNFTISLWIYPTNNNTSRPIISKTDAGLNLGYKIENNSGILKSSIFSLGTNCVLSAGSLDLNQWQLITVVYNGSNISPYINGELQGTPFTCSISTGRNTEDFLIGAQSSDSSRFAGKIDEIRIYQRALNQDEISNLFNYPASLAVSNLNGIWQIKEGIEKLDYANIEFTRSFKVLGTFRDSNGNLVNDNGNFDPLTKKIVYTVLWGDKKLEETQYVSRTNNNLVFAQTDWSAGVNPNQIVITAPDFFEDASSTIIYTTPDLLTIELGIATSSKIDPTYHWAWNDSIFWIDFYGIYYDVSTNELLGIASSSAGGISTNCLDLDACATSDYQVNISATTTSDYNEGDLYGYAWSPAIGWISFNCNQTGVGGTNNCATSNYKVRAATSTGYFSGFAWNDVCLLYTSDAADDLLCVDLGGRRILKKKNTK